MFEIVQSQLKRFDKPKKANHVFPFKGLLTCGYCGCSITAETQGGKYIYYHCTGARGKCGQKYIREETVALKLGEAIKCITLDQELVEWIREALKSSHSEEKEYHEKAIGDLRSELTKLENRLSRIYEDKIDGVIPNEQWEKLQEKYAIEIDEVKQRISRHTDANLDYYQEGSKILELAEDAYNQYVRQDNEEKRKLLDFVVSKFIMKGDEFIPFYRQPFDLLAVYWGKEDQEKRRLGQKSPIHQLWRPQGDLIHYCSIQFL